jgi:hypothetical protein
MVPPIESKFFQEDWMDKLAVISPAGVQVVEQRSTAPRLPDLAGKTVGEVWNGVFKGDETFPVLREEFRKRFPHTKIIPYTEFPFFPGDDRPHAQQAVACQIAALAKEKGCDAIISGNGA